MQCVTIRDELAAAPGERKVPVARGDHCRVTLWRLQPGQEIAPHTHVGDHVWVVQEGNGWLLAPEGEVPVGAGTVALIPEGEPHGMRAGEELVFVSVSAAPSGNG
ncbi:MAG: hypothetical protein Kow0092_03440 [Deferrisomatales bacterium]